MEMKNHFQKILKRGARMKKNAIRAALVLFMFSCVGISYAADPVKMKVTMTQVATHPYAVGATKFADLIKERTNGRYLITVYTDSQLAKGEREMIEALQQGTIEIYVGSTGPVGNFSPSMLIVDIPFLFRDYNHVDKVLDGPIGNQLLADLDKSGLKGLAFWENGFRHLTNSKKAVKTPEDAKGMKIRTMENKVHMTAFKTAGLNPAPMAWSEVYSALQQGVIDGEENPVAVIYGSKLYEVQKHMSLTGHVYSPALFIVSMKKWNQMPKADQAIFQKTALEVAKFERKINRDDEAKKLKEMEAKGFVVTRDVNKAAWQKAMKPAYTEFATQFGQKKMDAITNTK
jgi:TRAP-type transport system periplasmic protein